MDRIDEADVLCPQAAADGREGRAQHDRLHLAPPAIDAERFGGVLVLAHAGQLIADARALEIDLHEVIENRDDEGQIDPLDVAEAQRPEAWAERDRHSLGAGGEAAPAARHDLQHLGERDRRQREVRSLEPVGEKADGAAGDEREDDADHETEPRALVVAGARERRGVGPDTEERRVAERHLSGIAASHVPRGRQRAPQKDQDHAVEDEAVAHDDRHERGDGEQRRRHPAVGGHTPSDSAPRWPKSPAGRKTSTPMNRMK